MPPFKLTLKYILISLIAVFCTFFFHELSHWIAGTSLGYKMTMTLNSVTLAEGNYTESWHETLVSAAGPILTIFQAIAFFIIIQHTKNIQLYPFLFSPLYMRILAGALNVINLNDEGRISQSLGIGNYTLSIIVCLLLLALVIKTSRQLKLTAKFQLINILLTMIFSSILILSDQSFHIKIIN